MSEPVGMQLEHDDLQKITRQLGREPRAVLGVAKRCEAGHPQVIVTYPLIWEKGHPHIFPTLYWLTCPALNQAIGRFETEGWIGRLQEQLATDVTLSSAWQAAHADYARARVLLVPPKELAQLREEYPGQAKVLEEAGVGGIRGAGIKCLHTNFAHSLAKATNPIGELVAELLAQGDTVIDFCYDDELERFCSLD
ncbi:MAG: DUF501 domain-containing protein [Firmicutes bacterium]|nr:DUF501 domain-containing protein [Bacillota bacterium]